MFNSQELLPKILRIVLIDSALLVLVTFFGTLQGLVITGAVFLGPWCTADLFQLFSTKLSEPLFQNQFRKFLTHFSTTYYGITNGAILLSYDHLERE